jgi:hypothetical protein
VRCENNICPVRVPAPGFALVFLTAEGAEEDVHVEEMTFATTAQTRTMNTATVDPSVLATSNGHSGGSRQLGSTSKGSSAAVGLKQAMPGLGAFLAVVLGAASVVFIR